jgi:hypothetical protein
VRMAVTGPRLSFHQVDRCYGFRPLERVSPTINTAKHDDLKQAEGSSHMGIGSVCRCLSEIDRCQNPSILRAPCPARWNLLPAHGLSVLVLLDEPALADVRV